MSDRGIRCGESDAGRAVRHSRWHGAVSSALVSRSRAMPVGDRRSSPRAFLRLAMRDLVARRAAVPGFALPRDAGRRPALQPSPRFFAVGDARSRCASRSGAGFALPRDAGRRSAFQSPRFFAVGDARSRCASRSGAGFALPRDAGRRPALRFFVVGDTRSRCASRSGAGFRAPARCRSETGAPSPRFFAVGDTRSRCASRSGAGFRAPARCRSETGAPLFRGWRCDLARAQRCRVSRARCAETGAPLFRGWRYAISLRAAQRCRVSRSRAMPVGDRRSFAVSDAPSGQLAPARCPRRP